MTAFAGTSALMRLILRRDRVALPLWILLLAALPVAVASSIAELYPTTELRQGFAASMVSNPAVIALIGPLHGSTLGELVAWRMGAAGRVMLGLAALFTVIRHTRAEEEAGRRELLGATVVGREAPLAAAVLVTFGATLLVGALATLWLIAYGLPADGSVVYGLSLAAAGWVFAAIAAIAAQLTEGAGAARGIAGVVLGLSYMLRAVGDADAGLAWIAWLSPHGWIERTRPYSENSWGMFMPVLMAVIGLLAAAFILAARRDLSAGLLPPRLGPATAAPGLRTPLALAWRLQRGSLQSWSIGIVGIGLVIGNIAQTVTDQLLASPLLRELFAQVGAVTPGDIFFTLGLAIVGQVAALYTIGATLQLHSEELNMRADAILSTSVSRLRWAGSHLLVVAFGAALLLVGFGLAAGASYGLSSGHVTREAPRVLGAALAYLPAVWLFGAVAVALWGVVPRFARLSWVVLVACLVIELLGELQQGGQALNNLSPFTHVPSVLTGDASLAPIAGLLGGDSGAHDDRAARLSPARRRLIETKSHPRIGDPWAHQQVMGRLATHDVNGSAPTGGKRTSHTGCRRICACTVPALDSHA